MIFVENVEEMELLALIVREYPMEEKYSMLAVIVEEMGPNVADSTEIVLVMERVLLLLEDAAAMLVGQVPFVKQGKICVSLGLNSPPVMEGERVIKIPGLAYVMKDGMEISVI